MILVAGGEWVSAVLLVHVPDRHPGRLRVPRRAGGPPARRPPDEGAVPARGVGLRAGVPRRRPARHPAARRCSARPRTCSSQRPWRSSRSSASCSSPNGGSRRCAPRRPRALRRSPGRRCGRCSRASCALLLAYQVLSAMGSQVVDFLFFDRAAARYSGDDLTRFLAAYTAVLNLVDILFLAVLAGPLMRRFGLRLGLVLNPAVVAGSARGHGRRRRRTGHRVVRAVRSGRLAPHRRHRGHRRHDAHVDQRRLPGRPGRRSGCRCRRSSRASGSRSRSGPPACCCSSWTRSTSGSGR